MTALRDAVLGAPVTLWRLTHPTEPVEWRCLIAQPARARCVVRFEVNGRPLALPPHFYPRRGWSHPVDAAMRWAEQFRVALCQRGWRPKEER